MPTLDNIPMNLEQAIEKFESGDNSTELLAAFINLINLNFYEANYFAGMIYEDGTNGVDKNLEYAYFYYQRSVETIGYVEGYLALARMNYHGLGVPQDFYKAKEYYSIIENERGSLIAEFMLGRMHQYGQGVERDLRRARNFYESSVNKGSIYGMINLSNLEREEGNLVKSVWLRLRAGWNAMKISLSDKRDIRLRGG